MKLESILKIIKADGFRSHEIDWTIAMIIKEVQRGEPEAMRYVAALIHEERTKNKDE